MAFEVTSKSFQALKSAYERGDLKTASSLLIQVKLNLVSLPAVPPNFQESANAASELMLAREVLELSVLLSVKSKDDQAMERSFMQLKSFYADTKLLMPPSPQESAMFGLNLLRLLVQSRIAEFHTELELLSLEMQDQPSVRHAIQLEQWLMEGAYNKVLASSQNAPSELYEYFLAQLSSTVREEIASCSEKAYTKLKLSDAQKLMMFDTLQAVKDYSNEHGWNIQDDYIYFQNNASDAKDVPSFNVINNTLIYAKELERIV